MTGGETAPPKIPTQLQWGEYRCIRLQRKSKNPADGWSNPSNQFSPTDWQIGLHLSAGGNYGVLPGFGGLACLDADEVDRLAELGVTSCFSDTFTVKTGNGGSHYFFSCPELVGKTVLFDPERLDKNGHPVHLGELYGAGNYFLVGPGSIHPNGRRYTVLTDAPVKNIDLAIVQNAIEPCLTRTKTASPPRPGIPSGSGGTIVDTLNLRVADFLPPINARKEGDEIRGEHPVHGSETGTNLSIHPGKNTWYCFRCDSGGGALEALAVAEKIIQCSDARPGCLDGHWPEIFDALRRRGYDVPLHTRPILTPSSQPVKPEVDDPLKGIARITTEGTRNPKQVVRIDYPALAGYLLKKYRPIYFNEKLYVYSDGLYSENSGRIEAEIIRVCRTLGYKGSVLGITAETLHLVKFDNPALAYPFNPASDKIPVLNGVVRIDYETGEITLEPHSPDNQFSFVLPVKYDPAADGSWFHEHVVSQYITTPGDSSKENDPKDEDDPSDVLYQIPAQALLQMQGKKPYKKSYILQGDADGGKTTYLEILSCFFGEPNISRASLHQIGLDRFVNATLEGRILNTYDDLADIPLQNVGAFKALTGGFSHDIERKHQSVYSGRIFAVHVFSANAPPEVPEKVMHDAAWWSRWEYLHFDAVFDRDPGFTDRAFTDTNISGFFNRVLKMMIRIKNQGLVFDGSPMEVKDAWRLASDPFARFVNEHMILGKDETPYKKEHLFRAFVAFCRKEGIDERKIPSSLKTFTNIAFRSGFKEGKKNIDRQRIRVYLSAYAWKSDSTYREDRMVYE